MALSHLAEAVKMDASGRSAGGEESAAAGTVVSFIAVLGFKVYTKFANSSGIHMEEMGGKMYRQDHLLQKRTSHLRCNLQLSLKIQSLHFTKENIPVHFTIGSHRCKSRDLQFYH